MTPDRLAALAGAETSALELAELCERKAELLRQLAETCAAERLGEADSRWQWEARDIAERMERKAAMGKTDSYSVEGGRLAVEYKAGRPAWRLDLKPIARRAALALIAGRMAARLA